MDPALTEHLEWLRLRRLAPATISRRRRVLGWVGKRLGRPLLQASAADLESWRAALRVAPEAAKIYISDVRQFYRWAHARGLLPLDPAALIPSPRCGRRLPRPIGEASLMAAVTSAPPRIRPWLVLAGWAGLRACEIAWLRREHVLDTARHPVIVIAADATKGLYEHVIPMCTFVRAELGPLLPRRGWVFTRADGVPGPNSPNRVSRLANTYLHDLGIGETLHQLRHRFGTETYRVSRDLRRVQELMGHRTPIATAGYAAVAAVDAVATVEALAIPGLAPCRQAS